MRLPLSHLWFTNSRFESNRSLTRTALLFVIHHYAKFATFAVCFVIIPLPYALTEYSSLQSCCSFFSTPVNSQFDLSYDHSVSDSISQLIKGLQCSQLQPLGIIVRTSFHHVCFTLLQFDKGSEFLAAQRVYLFWLCYSYVRQRKTEIDMGGGNKKRFECLGYTQRSMFEQEYLKNSY